MTKDELEAACKEKCPHCRDGFPLAWDHRYGENIHKKTMGNIVVSVFCHAHQLRKDDADAGSS